MSAASYVEFGIVMLRKVGKAGQILADQVISNGQIQIVPVDAHQAQLAVEAFTRFGKGRHPAALNFGDCFAYALAKSRNEPLLFKGNDFTQTDIQVATY